MRKWIGLARSLIVYWRPGRQRGLRRLYRPLVRPGDLVFDIGAHLGDRTAAFAALGARVVALEPQRHLLPWLRRLAGGREGVTVRRSAVGRALGRASLSVSSRTPTMSTLADRWRDELHQANPGFRDVRWDETQEVPVTTLDELIGEFGTPSFCKLDVEGYEAEALAGLSQPIEALSFEFVQGGLDIALACVRRLVELGTYEYNAVRGEERTFCFGAWMPSNRIEAWLRAGAAGIPSGDLYARLVWGSVERRAGSAEVDERGEPRAGRRKEERSKEGSGPDPGSQPNLRSEGNPRSRLDPRPATDPRSQPDPASRADR